MATQPKAVFTQGSTFMHLLRMTATGTIGLIAVFMVDVLNMIYIARLGDVELTAAIGFAGVIAFLTISFCIGLSIATAALVSRSIGAQEGEGTRVLSAANLSFMMLATGALSLLLLPFQPWILQQLGAAGRIFDQGLLYLIITTPSLILMGIGMACSSILRAVGDAKRSMNVTLAGGMTTLVLDPIFIFYFDLGLEGAAIVTVFSRIAMAGLGLYACVRIHNVIASVSYAGLKQNFQSITTIAVPAVLTNIATPIGSAYVTYALAFYGAEAVSAGAIINRMIPFTFCGLFALSGAVGPILGQNYGAQNYVRLLRVLKESFFISTCYALIVTLILVLSSPALIHFFNLYGQGADLFHFFCMWVAPSFAFLGIVFIANATFNTLGKPVFSTIFNWLRATIGTIPFVYFGGVYFGALGVISGQAIGSVVFGCVAMVASWQFVKHIGKTQTKAPIPQTIAIIAPE